MSVWLSVDPMAHKYPDISPYMYCVGNPVKLVDPDGRWVKGAGLLRNLFKSDSRIKAEDKVHEFKNKGYLAEKHKDKGTKEWYVSFYKKSDDEASDGRVSGTFGLMYFSGGNELEPYSSDISINGMSLTEFRSLATNSNLTQAVWFAQGYPDLITLSYGVGGASGGGGAHRAWELNILYTAEGGPKIFGTITETQHKCAFNIDDGFDITFAWYTGCTLVNPPTKEMCLGDSKSYGLDFGVGLKYIQMFNESGDIIFHAFSVGGGFGGGFEWGSERYTHQ